MEEYTLAELGVFLGILGGILTSILLTIQKSKCEKIKCFGTECCERKIKYKSTGEIQKVVSNEPAPEP
jgi:hypothetical protein